MLTPLPPPVLNTPIPVIHNNGVYSFTLPDSDTKVILRISKNQVDKYPLFDYYKRLDDVNCSIDKGLACGTTETGVLFLCSICRYVDIPGLVLVARYIDASEIPVKIISIDQICDTRRSYSMSTTQIYRSDFSKCLLDSNFIFMEMNSLCDWSDTILGIFSSFSLEDAFKDNIFKHATGLWFNISALMPIKEQLIKWLQYKPSKSKSKHKQSWPAYEPTLDFTISRLETPARLPSNQEIFVFGNLALSPYWHNRFLLAAQIPNAGALFNTCRRMSQVDSCPAMMLATLIQPDILCNVKTKSRATQTDLIGSLFG